jgi:hypothetical protein
MGKAYLLKEIGPKDYFEVPYNGVMIDGKTKYGPWATMSETSWRDHGIGRFGIGYAQKYEKQVDGRWLRIRG